MAHNNNISALSLRHIDKVSVGAKTAHFCKCAKTAQFYIRCAKTAHFYKCAKTAHFYIRCAKTASTLLQVC